MIKHALDRFQYPHRHGNTGLGAGQLNRFTGKSKRNETTFECQLNLTLHNHAIVPLFFPLYWVSTSEKEAGSVTQTLERHTTVYQWFFQTLHIISLTLLLSNHHTVLDFIVCPRAFRQPLWKPLGGNLIPVFFIMRHKEADERPNVIEKSCRFICLCPYRTCLK